MRFHPFHLFILSLTLLVSCRSARSAESTSAVESRTSLIGSEASETAVAVSSLRSLGAELDSVDIIIEPACGDTVWRYTRDTLATALRTYSPKGNKVRIRAKRIRLSENGRTDALAESHEQHTDSIEHAAEADTKEIIQSDETKVFDPPDITTVLCFAVTVAAVVIIVRHFR